MHEGDEIIVDIEALSYGRGAVARSDGKVVFVEGAAPGDRVRVRVSRQHPRWAESTLVGVVEAGAARVEAPCPVVDRCGGCPWQHVAYQTQLEAKRRAVVDSLERIAGIVSPPVDPIVASPQRLGYRNRLKLRFERGRLGFYSAATHQLVPIPDCLLAEERVRGGLAVVESFVASLATRVMRVEIASRGELSGIVVAINSAGRLRRADVERVKAFIAAGDNPVTGVVMWGRGWHRSWGDTRRRFTVEPGTTLEPRGRGFGQVNTAANRLLVATVLETLELAGPSRVLDLYAGAGNFTLPMARRGARVTAVEADGELLETAGQSAAHHGLDGIELHHARVEDFLGRERPPAVHRIVANPPRSGLVGAAASIARLRAPRIVYVSCNPTTLARDAKVLVEHRYRLVTARAIDLFPHTFHVETVCGFELT
jgi:23S rRNA (uracil1939-C5)-methyltransferase